MFARPLCMTQINLGRQNARQQIKKLNLCVAKTNPVQGENSVWPVETDVPKAENKTCHLNVVSSKISEPMLRFERTQELGETMGGQGGTWTPHAFNGGAYKGTNRVGVATPGPVLQSNRQNFLLLISASQCLLGHFTSVHKQGSLLVTKWSIKGRWTMTTMSRLHLVVTVIIGAILSIIIGMRVQQAFPVIRTNSGQERIGQRNPWVPLPKNLLWEFSQCEVRVKSRFQVSRASDERWNWRLADFISMCTSKQHFAQNYSASRIAHKNGGEKGHLFRKQFWSTVPGKWLRKMILEGWHTRVAPSRSRSLVCATEHNGLDLSGVKRVEAKDTMWSQSTCCLTGEESRGHTSWSQRHRRRRQLLPPNDCEDFAVGIGSNLCFQSVIKFTKIVCPLWWSWMQHGRNICRNLTDAQLSTPDKITSPDASLGGGGPQIQSQGQEF